MLWAVLVTFTYSCLTVAMAVSFWRTNDGSAIDMVEWGALYFFGVVAPILWSVRLFRLFRKHGLELSGANLILAWSPVMVAVTILVFALPLIWGGWQQR
jgi:hypothetical protein